LKLKPTTYVLIAVVVILGAVAAAGGSRLWRQITAPRIVHDATPAPQMTVAHATPTGAPAAEGWEAFRDERSGQHYLTPPPGEVRVLRAAFAALLHRTRVLSTSDAELLAYDREVSMSQARALLADDFDWSLLETLFVFVHSGMGPENTILCADTAHCRVTQAVLGIEAVLIFDDEVCASAGAVPCLAPLTDAQLDGRDNLITADFEKDAAGVWKLTHWEMSALPAAPKGW